MAIAFSPTRFQGAPASEGASPARRTPLKAVSSRFGAEPPPTPPSTFPDVTPTRRDEPMDQVNNLAGIFKALLTGLHMLEDRFPIAKPLMKPFQELLNLGVETVERLRGMVDRDALTRVRNRQAFDRDLRDAFSAAQTTQTPLAAMMVDIDKFKTVNDTLGHDGGDKVLKRTAEVVEQTLEANASAQAKLYRYGGEEFVILAPGLTLEQSRALAESVRQAVQEIDWEGERRRDMKLDDAGLDYVRNQRDHGAITISMGLAHADFADPQTTEAFATDESLIKRADERLYQAKKNGRNQTQG